MSDFTATGAMTRKVNTAISGFILLVLLASTLMIGSNRPVFWMLNSAVILSVTALYLFLVSFGMVKLRYGPARWRLVGTLGFVYLAGLLAHMALGALFPNLRMHSEATMMMGFIRVLSYAALLFLTLQVATNVKRARNLAWAVFGVVILMAIYALLAEQVPELLLYKKSDLVTAVTGPFINRNSFATFLAMGSALGTALVLRGERENENNSRTKRGRMNVELVIGRLAMFVAVLLLFATILTTGSRMGALVGLLGIFVPVVLRVMQADRADGSRQALVGLALALVALLSFVVVSAMYGGVLFDRLGSTGMAANVRWNLYENVWAIIKERPLLGYGFDSFELAFREGQKLPVSPDLRWQNAHNTFLELWLELGLVLGSLPPLICGLVLLRLFQRGAQNQYTAYMAQAGVAVILIAGIHSLVDFSLEIEANVYLFLVILGLGLAPDDSKIT